MANIPLWDTTSPQMEHSLMTEPCLGYTEALAYVDSPFACKSFRPILHVETAIPPMSALEHYPQGRPFDFEQGQRGYLHSFQNDIPAFQGEYPKDLQFDGRESVWIDPLSSASLQSPSAHSSPSEEGSIVSPRATRHPSFSSTQSLSDYSIQLLENMTLQSPVLDLDTVFFGENHTLPTISDRVQKLSLPSMRLFKSCGPDPSIQSAVLNILESPEIQVNAPITSEMAAPLLEKIEYPNRTHGRGKRGAPQFYKCLWGSCGEKMTRKLHALEHIMNHLDNRPHVCDHCGKGFVRKNELKKHSPCKALKRKLKCVQGLVQFDNLACTPSLHCYNGATEPRLLPGWPRSSLNSAELGSSCYSQEPLSHVVHQL